MSNERKKSCESASSFWEMDPKPYISIVRGRGNEPRQAMNGNHIYCAIVLHRCVTV